MNIKNNHINSITKLFCIGFAFAWLITLISGLSIVILEKNQIDTFFDDQQITRYRINAPTKDGQQISAIVMIANEHLEIVNYSIPTILFVPGANNQKDNNFYYKVQAVKLGFAVVAMEQRGHGESGGYFSLYGYEYQDISDVITYISLNFPQINYTHMGLVGMSLGGGSALGAQALDDRIYVSSIYHPAANLTSFFETIGVHPGEFFGFLPGMEYPYPICFGIPDWDRIYEETWYNRSAINLVTPENTKNLLLLHGTLDDMLQPYMTEDIVEIVDPNNIRSDIQYIIRDSLGHGENEADLLSFKLTMTWFRHFLMNKSIDITDLESEANLLEIASLDYPSTNNYPKFFEYSTIFLILFLFTLFYLLLLPQHSKAELPTSENRDIKKSMICKSIIVLIGFLFGGFIGLLRNPSIIYGIFFYPSIIIIPGLLIFMYVEERKWITQDFSKEKIVEFVISYLIFGIPFLLWIGLYNLGGIWTINRTASPGFWVGFGNILMFASIFTMPFLFMRNVPKKYSYLLIPLTFIGALMVGIFISVPNLALLSLSGNYLLVIVALLFGLLNWLVYNLIIFLQKFFTRNIPATLICVGTIVAVLIWFRFMRIF